MSRIDQMNAHQESHSTLPAWRVIFSMIKFRPWFWFVDLVSVAFFDDIRKVKAPLEEPGDIGKEIRVDHAGVGVNLVHEPVRDCVLPGQTQPAAAEAALVIDGRYR